MPELSILVLFTTACFAITATPGPDMLLIISRTLGQGRASGFATYIGIAVGTYCHALAAAFGLSELFLAAPMAYDIIRYTGAAYLLYLAFKTINSKPSSSPSPCDKQSYSTLQVFIQGLITNLLNPKVILFVLALFPQFIQPKLGNVTMQILILATILNFVGLLVNGTVILMANKVGQRFSNRRRFKKLPQYLLASVFGGLATRLLLSER